MRDIRTRRTRQTTVSLATAAVAVLTIAGLAQSAAAQNLSAAETAAAVTHGPWPPPPEGAQTDPAAVDLRLVALGRRLFFDAGLSPSGKVACSSCHRPERAWSDGRSRGKGVATTTGAFLALSPAALGVTFVVFAVTFAAKRIVSLASITSAAALPVVVFVLDKTGAAPSHWSLLAASVLIAVVMLAKHHSNIKRLLAGEEPVLQRTRR